MLAIKLKHLKPNNLQYCKFTEADQNYIKFWNSTLFWLVYLSDEVSPSWADKMLFAYSSMPATFSVCGWKELYFWRVQRRYLCCQTWWCTQWLIMDVKGAVRRFWSFFPFTLCVQTVWVCLCMCWGKQDENSLSQYFWKTNRSYQF